MQELKIRTHGNPNLSKAIQDELFKLGYKWHISSHYIQESCTDAGNIWIYADSGYPLGWNPVRNDTRPHYKEVNIYDLIEMNAQNDTKQNKIRGIREEMEEHNKVGEELAARLKEEEEE